MKAIAVIPARGGSKRIPRKNIRPFAGKPMLAWSIDAAKKSGCFERVVVSTDDDEIAEVAKEYGAEVPFKRPAQWSDDHSTTLDVMSHAVHWLRDHAAPTDAVCCIYATAPFIQPQDLRAGLDLLRAHPVDYVISVTHYPFPIQRALRCREDGRIEMMQPENVHVRSQDLEPTLHDAGQFYWGQTQAWLSKERILGPQTLPLILPSHRVQDIDTEEDWVRAQWLFAAMQSSSA
jgi:pseudaminic acid cytidylyltransferase